MSHDAQGVYAARPTPPPLLTVSETAVVLGISRRQVYRLVADGRLRPAGRVGQRLRFKPADLDDCLERGSP
jgi:excisionase family DNA binding protein